MKPISEMTLEECLEEMRVITVKVRGIRQIAGRLYSLADRIHSLTRWIPVSERMPTEEDGNQRGLVFVWNNIDGYVDAAHWRWIALDRGITHWRRIDTP